jgi:hypothetical protein
VSIQAGLVGLPNVGKSTLFNALTKSSAPAENYPFCTIDPHTAIANVPDKRLQELKEIYQSKKIIPATVNFVDIAGLVKGAASGEGLGNKFLGHIREVDLILFVLRCFEDTNIVKEGGIIDPLEDFDTILSELILKDLESIEHRLQKMALLIKKTRQSTEKSALEKEQLLLHELKDLLGNSKNVQARQVLLDAPIKTIPLLSTKDFLIIANVDEDNVEQPIVNKFVQQVLNHFGKEKVVPVCAKIEHELSQLDDEAAKEMMGMFGMSESCLKQVISQTYKQLGLITFFTCGPQEIHAWPIKNGITVRQAAGEIHSDLERGFICAEVFNYTDLHEHKTTNLLKDLGKIRKEGQDYLVQDGDIILVRFNV